MSEAIRVGVVGARGRMGHAVVHAVSDAPDMVLTAEVDLGDSLDALLSSKTQVVIDFTTADAAMTTIEFALPAGINGVVGTTGFDQAQMSKIKALSVAHANVGLVIAPNFSIGAVLMMSAAAEAAPHFESVEIIEYHRKEKLDSPSGTSKATAELIAKARKEAGKAAFAPSSQSAKARGEIVEGVSIHSVRGDGMVAHQEVVFGREGERYTIRHDSFDRASFMPGVLLAIRAVMKRPGLTLGLQPLL
jgi:4-hydroxy-tetrahydrodipicolinate reductase